jgi:hypothetical protein
VVVLAENNLSLRSRQGLPVSDSNAVETLGNKIVTFDTQHRSFHQDVVFVAFQGESFTSKKHIQTVKILKPL